MRRPNVLFVVMDTARAEYAYDPEVMPNLARIASEGTTFANAFANGPWTVPSHASMFTGQYTTDHDTHAGTKRFDPDVPTLAEALGDAGYRTACFSNNTWLSPEFGYDRGFDEFVAGWELLEGGADLLTIRAESDSTSGRLRAVFRERGVASACETLVNAAYAKFVRKRYDDGAFLTNLRLRRWLSDAHRRDEPFFAFVNYLEPHLPYEPPGRDWRRFLPSGVAPSDAAGVNQNAHRFITGNAEMTERDFAALEALYKGELAYLDRRIGRLYETLEASGALEETLLIIAGDHGENLGDHGLMDHQYNLYDTVLRVP
ncbi:sulfatase, partial [Halovivax sp.]|uniref:sulfatase n=1 Tax=Halovivax sp. TaxID=1935978 RepID=UPI0025C0751C